MKTFTLSIIMIMLVSFISVNKVAAQIVYPITEDQYYSVVPSSTATYGFFMFAAAGGSTSSEFGLNTSNGPDNITLGDVGNVIGTGGVWNWGAPYQFDLSNLGGEMKLTFTQGANSVTSSVPSTPALQHIITTTNYSDIYFAVVQNDQVPQAGIKVANLRLDGQLLPNLMAGTAEPQVFQGFEVENAGENWSNITGTFIPEANALLVAPFENDLTFNVFGIQTDLAATTPEPSSICLLVVGMALLFVFRRYQRRKEV